jgi:hypothetical protein
MSGQEDMALFEAATIQNKNETGMAEKAGKRN